MNERIKLPAQEWLGHDPENGDIHGYTFEQMREFAESIINKCLELCYCRGMNDELYAGQLKAAAYIEEYFGVEELEDSACPLCGEDGGTTCGMPGCQY